MSSEISISAIITNYNHGKYIGEALESIVSQSFLPLEILVIDDASTDNSIEIIKQFQRRCPIIELYQNKNNCGIFANVEKLISLTRGDFIAGLAADDKWLPGYLEKSVTILNQHPNAGLCCTNPVYFDDAGNTKVFSHSWLNQPGFLLPDILADCINGSIIFGHTAIFNKEKFIACGGYNPDLKWHCDWFTSLVMAFRYGICHVPEGLSAMRENNNTYSTAGRSNWNDQKVVLKNILNLANSPAYHDVFPHFVRGNIMATFGDDIVKAVIEYPELIDDNILLLINKQLTDWVQKLDKHNSADMFYGYYLAGLIDYQSKNWANADTNLTTALKNAEGIPSTHLANALYYLKCNKSIMLRG
jgi:glycosyltransferase involved in cell wall biosynthesis